MILTNVSDTIHADFLVIFLAYPNFALQCHQTHFDFDLTCDATGDPVVIKICFP